MASDWDFFEKAYCISTIEREDRRQQAHDQFARVGLAGRIEFVIVPRHPTDREKGIYESHMLCMSKGLQAGVKQMLIFEDDILFDRFSPAVLRGCIDFMAADPTWHMLFLGCMVKSSRRTPNPAVQKIRYRSLTHAYVIHERFARTLLQHPWQSVPYDDFLLNQRDDRTYAAYPAFAFQSNSPSDNTRYLPLDKLRRLLGGLCRLQKSNEFYQRHRWPILAAHALVLMLTLLAVHQ